MLNISGMKYYYSMKVRVDKKRKKRNPMLFLIMCFRSKIKEGQRYSFSPELKTEILVF